MTKYKAGALDVQSFADHQFITQPNPLRSAVRRTYPDDPDDPVARAEQALAGLAGEFQSWMNQECARLAAGLRVVGIHVDAIMFPAVPLGHSRLRFIMNAHHTPEHIDRVVATLQLLMSFA